MFVHCFVIGSKHSESISNIRVVQVVFPDHVKGNPLIFFYFVVWFVILFLLITNLLS